MASIYARGRDNARTPMQWSEEPNAGFTTGTPWLPVNPNYVSINARQALADPNSVFYHYQKLIALRKRLPVFREGTFTLLEPDSTQLFAYTRDTEDAQLLVVCNFYGAETEVPAPDAGAEYRLLLANYADTPADRFPARLRPYEAVAYWVE